MNLTFRYRLGPSKRQHRALERILEDQRQLYNAALEERIDAYRKSGLARTYFDQTIALTEWRRDDPDAARLPANLQRATLKRLDVAYNGFLGRCARGEHPGFPRFRSRNQFKSFGFRQFSGITLNRERLRFKGMPGALRVHFHRSLPATALVRSCHFRRIDNRWYVGFEVELPAEPERPTRRAVGIDLGVTTFAATSNGELIPNPRVAERADRELRRVNRSLSRKQRGSAARAKACAAVRKCHNAIARRRLDFLHKVSARLIRNYDLIAYEALPFANLAKGTLAKQVRDASWSKFIALLKYKAEKAGARAVAVNHRHTTVLCSRCEVAVPKERGDRLHLCPVCGLCLDRDINAARNVLKRAGVGPRLANANVGGRSGGNLGEPRILGYAVTLPSVQGQRVSDPELGL